MNETDQIKEILSIIQIILTSLVPIAITIFYTVRDKAKEAKRDLDKKNTARNVEKFTQWEHEESQAVITQIKDLCNYYKDKGHMDLVNYVQLENGTVASSKLCNMFVTCLAEDDRFSTVPKMINKFKRIPFSTVSEVIGELKLCRSNGTDVLEYESIDDLHNYLQIVSENVNVHSIVAAPVYDSQDLLIGMCLFYYSHDNFNNQDVIIQKEQIKQFTASIETVFVHYHLARKNKMAELAIDITDM